MICTKCKFRKGCKAQEISECKVMQKKLREIGAVLRDLREQAARREELLAGIEKILEEIRRSL